ncbi:ABC transporter substrate-binding protein [Mycetocola manganoxydans]|uniref:ABC transporter substrate-binding protein n=1 Tax=Mycetocola manganoxydans TaxID=699879 RepID=A0A3L6ZM18_9MICO|nr:ABC transporter substrate-binding protein [Mycetocola manganoxydans]RLP68878.1 ABC transporter substrate-binding protein [Mycetocola manganoxydans]GHD51329.1 peptide ABC transporter substrate-binding protein [Mycetocola manganoxydans]
MSHAMKRKRATVAGVMLASALTLTACTAPTGDANGGDSSGKSEVVVYTGVTGDFAENFNPFIEGNLQSTRGVIYEPLFFYNITSGGDPEPLLGESFEFNEAGTELTITMRDGVKWSDGEDLTAEDVVYTFELITEVPAFNTAGYDGQAELVDEKTVKFTFPEPSFTDAVSYIGNTPIVPEHIWAEKTDPTTDQNAEPIGSGAFTLSEFNSQNYLLAANEEYWGGRPEIDTVRYISLTGNQSATDTLLQGEIDLAGIFLPDVEGVFKGTPLEYTNTPLNQTSFFTCSDEAQGCTGPQTDVAVRTAIYNALNRDQLNSLAFSSYNGQMSPTYGLLERDEKWIADEFSEPVPGTPNVDAAIEALEGAGYARGSDGIFAKDGERVSLTVQVVTGWTDYIAAIDASAEQLLEAGIELKPAQVSFQEWTANKSNGNFQLSLDSLGQGVAADPYYLYMRYFHSDNTAPVGETSGQNFARYSNATVDQAIDAAGSTLDEAVKAEQYAVVQAEIVRDMPYIPILVNSALTIYNTDNVQGWPTEDNLYAYPRPDRAWDNGIVLKTIKPAN